MYFGMPFGSSFGNPEDIVIVTEAAKDLGGVGLRVRVLMAPGYAQWGRLILDGVGQGNPQYIPDTASGDDPVEFRGVYSKAINRHTFGIMPQGDWSSPTIDIDAMALFFQEDRSTQFEIRWKAAVEYFSYGDAGQFTNWDAKDADGNLTVVRFKNCKPNRFRPSWGELELTLTTDTGVHTATLSKNGVVMAEGSRTGDGTIEFEAVDGSGLVFSADLTYTADIASGSGVVIRFPQSYKIHYKTTPFTGPDFPRTAEATIEDDPSTGSNQFTYASDDVEAPGYYVVVHQVDDAGNEGNGIQGGGVFIAVSAPPEPPGDISFEPNFETGGMGGGSMGGLPMAGSGSQVLISFLASETVGATYNVYDSTDQGILDMTHVNHTIVAWDVGVTVYDGISDVPITFTGWRYIVVRAVDGGVEEGNNNVCAIEYYQGNIVYPRPNAPYVSGGIEVDGLELTVPFSIQTVDSKATPDQIQIFIQTADPAVTPFDYTTPSATLALPTSIGNSASGSISVTAGVAGFYYFAIRSRSDDGYTQSDNVDYYGPVALETTVPGDPDDIIAVEGV